MSGVAIAVCADDFGLNAQIGRGVMALAERGRLNGVSCMVGAPAWATARAEVATLRAAGIDVGLHLDLTEHPLDAALRQPLGRLITQAWLRRLPDAALRGEVERQIDRFEQVAGHGPDYIDGHQHVHQLPQVRDALVDVLSRTARRPWVRSTRRPTGLKPPAFATASERLKPRIIEGLGARGLQREAARAGLPTSRRLLGVYGFGADDRGYRQWIAAWLAVAEDGDVLMCHPATAGEAAGDPIAGAREVELRVLGSDWMHEAMARHAVTGVPPSQRYRATAPGR
jgi:predicted glycoside hydrolase/deacetylase ChbG (UPF0249 family)